MIIRLITKVTLEDDDGNLIKEKEYGRAYLTEVDMVEAANDWWEVYFYNRLAAKHKQKKKRYSKESNEIYKIIDILSNALRRTLFGRFLCENKADIADRVEEEFEDYKENE